MDSQRRFGEPLPGESEDDYLRAVEAEEEALSEDLWSQVPYDPDVAHDEAQIEKRSNDHVPTLNYVPNQRKEPW